MEDNCRKEVCLKHHHNTNNKLAVLVYFYLLFEKNWMDRGKRSVGDYSGLELCHIDQITETLKELEGTKKKVYVLSLARNMLKTISLSFCSVSTLIHLKALDISKNSLSAIPKDVCLLSNLETLNATFNNISVIPNTIGRLKKLKHLFLGMNQISLLPFTEIVQGCLVLEQLYLTSNPLCKNLYKIITSHDWNFKVETTNCILKHDQENQHNNNHNSDKQNINLIIENKQLKVEIEKLKTQNDRLKKENDKMRSRWIEAVMELGKLSKTLTKIRKKGVKMQKQQQEDSSYVACSIFEKYCVICLDQRKNIVLLPCRHFVLCESCCSKVEICPCCRSPINDSLCIFT